MVRYAGAVIAVAVAVTATLLLRPWMGSSVSILFFPAIIVTATYGGYGASLFAAVLSTSALGFFIVPPYNSFDLGTDDALRLAVFGIVAVATASLSSARQRAEDAQHAALLELQRGIATLRKVSGWPLVVDTSVAGGARKVLAHAANVVASECAIAVWETEDEPWIYMAASSGSPDMVTRYPPAELTPGVAGALESATFLGAAPLDGGDIDVTVSDDGTVSRWHGTPVHEDIARHLGGHGFASAPFEVEHLKGRVFFSGLKVVTEDVIPLVEVVAREIGNSLEQLYAHDRIQQLAIREDRIRVARDLHDGVLQSLTGVRFQLQTLADEDHAPSSVSDRLLAIERAIAIEQRELRLFIEDLKPAARRAGIDGPVAHALEEMRARLSVEWKTPITLRVAPQNMALPTATEQAVRLMVREAVVNALKHAHPSRVSVDVESDGRDTLRIVVGNDGRGFPFRGRFDHEQLAASNAGPASLRERVHELAGTLAIESMPTGSRVEISVPI